MLCVIWCSVANRTNHPEQQSTYKAESQPYMRSPFGAGRISGRDTYLVEIAQMYLAKQIVAIDESATNK